MVSRTGGRSSGLLSTDGVRGRAGETRKEKRMGEVEWWKEGGLFEADAPGWVNWDRFYRVSNGRQGAQTSSRGSREATGGSEQK